MKDKSNLIWIDLEMTGLDTQRDYIIEIASIVTDKNLNILAEGPNLIIHQPDEIINNMDEWNTKQHGRSGLIEKVKSSKITETQAEKETIKFLEQFVFSGQSPLCGNTICQDRRFLARCMPELEEFCHYRNLDVSSIRELGCDCKFNINYSFCFYYLCCIWCFIIFCCKKNCFYPHPCFYLGILYRINSFHMSSDLS